MPIFDSASQTPEGLQIDSPGVEDPGCAVHFFPRTLEGRHLMFWRPTGVRGDRDASPAGLRRKLHLKRGLPRGSGGGITMHDAPYCRVKPADLSSPFLKGSQPNTSRPNQ